MSSPSSTASAKLMPSLYPPTMSESEQEYVRLVNPSLFLESVPKIAATAYEKCSTPSKKPLGRMLLWTSTKKRKTRKSRNSTQKVLTSCLRRAKTSLNSPCLERNSASTSDASSLPYPYNDTSTIATTLRTSCQALSCSVRRLPESDRLAWLASRQTDR